MQTQHVLDDVISNSCISNVVLQDPQGQKYYFGEPKNARVLSETLEKELER